MKKRILIFLSILVFNLNLFSQEKDTLEIFDIVNLSIEEILNLPVKVGNISDIKLKKSPVVLTTITSSQILTSQARNLATLLEIYVPGLLVMTHSEGDKIGLRGHIAAQNYKLLLMVNGVNIANLVHEGAITELDMWDINDIEKVEVIRGPGSVTYGTGAIAGVINITTKGYDPKKKNINAGLEYDPVYNSTGAFIQTALKKEKLNLFLHSGFRKTLGYQSPQMYYMNGDTLNDNRYIGERYGDATSASAYLADGLDRPQVKLHADINYGKNWKAWARYTQAGQVHYVRPKTAIIDDNGSVTETKNRRHVSTRMFMSGIKYTHHIASNLVLTPSLTYSSQEYVRFDFRNPDYEWDHYNNIRDYAFSQKNINLNAFLNYSRNKLNLVAGVELKRTFIMSPWGKSSDFLLIREGKYIINDTLTNKFYNDEDSQFSKGGGFEEVGDGIFFNTYSFLFEANYKLSEKTSLLMSGRIDKPDISSIMFSPRISIAHEINTKNTVRLVGQKSSRMMPIRAQYLHYKYSKNTEDITNEEINGLEIIYTYLQNSGLVYHGNIFYNNINAVGFTGDDLHLIGKQKLIGAEMDVVFRNNNYDFGFNHAYIKQMDFSFSDKLKDGEHRNNITYSDYDYHISINDSLQLELTDYGNDLNNIPKNYTKLYVTRNLFNYRLKLHVNARIMWDFTGTYNEVKVYQNAYNSIDENTLSEYNKSDFLESKRIFENEISLIEKSDAYQLDFRMNASLSYFWNFTDSNKLIFTLYSDNLLGSKKKYYVSTGSSSIYPERLQYLEEPITIGAKIRMVLK